MTATPPVGMSARSGKPDLSDLAPHLDEIEALGVDSIELPMFEMDVVVGGRVRQAQLGKVKAACAGRKLGWTVHGPLAINFMDDEIRLPRHFEVLKASIEAAGEVGAQNYVLHTGFRPVQLHEGLEAAYRRQREWLAKAGDLAKAHGLTVCVENLFDEHWGKVHTASPSRLAAEIAAVGHPHVRATVDFSHAHIEVAFRGGDLIEELKPLASLARHLHVHDSFGRPDDIYMYTDGERLAYGHGDLHLPIGWGSIPWRGILDACIFPPDTVLNIELSGRYWYMAEECVAEARKLAQGMRLANR